MPREFTTGFDVLGLATDPTPGDPDAIRAFAQRHGDVRDDARRAVEVLGTGGEIESGRGEAMDALRRALKSLPDKLQRTASSFDQAARAYETYADSLAERQAELDDAMRSATAVSALATAPLPDPDDDATPEERATAAAREDEILAAQSSLGRARSLAEQIKQARDLAAQDAADELELAAAKAIPERGFFEKLGDFFASFPFVRLLVDIVLAIIAIVAPVLGLALAGLALAAFTVASLANGSFKLGTFVVDLLALVPGGSLLRGAGRAAGSIPLTIGTRGTGDIVSSIQRSREAISSIPLQNASLVFTRETAALGGRTFVETSLNGDPIDGGTIVLTALGAGVFSGGLQFTSDRKRQRVHQENESLPPGQKKAIPFDAEHDLDSIQEDARERIIRSTTVTLETELDKLNVADDRTPLQQQAFPPSEESSDQAAATNINNGARTGFLPDPLEPLAGVGAGFLLAKFGFDPIANRLLTSTPPPVPGTSAPTRPASPVGANPPQLPPLRPVSPLSIKFRK